MKLSPTEIFNGKKILFIGGTGFVGKVTLSMLLHNFPNIGRVYATVRARDAQESNNRFWRSEEHTSELQSRQYLVCRLLLEKKKHYTYTQSHAKLHLH